MDMFCCILQILLLLLVMVSFSLSLTLEMTTTDQSEDSVPITRPYMEELEDNGYGPLVATLEECPTNMCDCEKNLNINEPVINCKNKRLQFIPSFNSVGKIYHEIDFSLNNYIKTLPDNAFRNLQVKNINLFNNFLQNSEINEAAFEGLALFLEGLKIQGNDRNHIPYYTMVNLTNLKSLHLKSFIQDSAIENSYFEYFHRLEELKMFDINQVFFDDTTFAGKIPNLLRLTLSNVYIDSIPSASLQHLSGLQVLHIKSNNRLKTVLNNAFDSLRSLKELSLSYNPSLEYIEPQAFTGISRSLTKLHLGSNGLNSSALQSLASQHWPLLEDLTLSYNDKLAPWTASVFEHMGNLKYLYVEAIGLKTLDSSIMRGLTNLLAINLEYNKIETIQDRTFMNSRNLVELKLQFQMIGSLGKTMVLNPNTFAGIEDSLEVLNLWETPVDSDFLWDALKVLTELQELNLRKTTVDTIPEQALSKNSKLRLLDLQENEIQTLPKAAFRGLQDSLVEVLLENNKLNSISECVFKNFTLLTKLGLRGNPLSCDCGLVWLHRYLHRTLTPENMYLKTDYTCTKPATFEGKVLYDIPEFALCSNAVEEDCSFSIITPKPGTTLTTIKTTKPSSTYRLSLRIPSQTENTLTVVWSAEPKTSITGYKIEYYPTTEPNFKQYSNKHRDDTFHLLDNLNSGTFYKVCIIAEINNVWDLEGKVCQVTQTPAGSNEQKNNDDNTGNRNEIMTGVIIATVAAVVLISVGVCAVIRYKYRLQKLQQVPFTLSPGMAGRAQMHCGEDMVVCTVPNEYVSAGSLVLPPQYNMMPSPRMVHRQFGVDMEENPYHPYHRINIRRNPYENDDDMTDEEPGFNKSQEVLFKPDLGERHSAPSRLDAADLLNDRNSRPLPATPKEQKEATKDKPRSNTLQAKRGRKKKRQGEGQRRPNDRTRNPGTSSQDELESSDYDEDRLILGSGATYARVNKDKANKENENKAKENKDNGNKDNENKKNEDKAKENKDNGNKDNENNAKENKDNGNKDKENKDNENKDNGNNDNDNKDR